MKAEQQQQKTWKELQNKLYGIEQFQYAKKKKEQKNT